MKNVPLNPEKSKFETENSLRLLSLQEAAELLAVSSRTVRRLADDGQIPLIRVGRGIRFRYSSLLTFLERSEMQGAGQ